MPELKSKSVKYDVCLEHPCFVFRSELPFVILDPTMEFGNQTLPFKCRTRSETFTQLRGPFFDILDKIPFLDEAYCIWVGPSCTFNDMVRFVEKQSENTVEGQRQFIVGGMLFYVPSRVSRWTYQSAPLVQGKIQIIGPRNTPRGFKKGMKEGWDILQNPFDKWSWLVLFVYFVLFLVLRIWIGLLHLDLVWTNKKPKERLGQVMSVFYSCFPGAQDPDNKSQTGDKTSNNDDDKVNLKYHWLSKLWFLTLGVIYTIVFLYFEVGLLLDQQSVDLGKELGKLGKKDLEKFHVTGGTAQEKIFESLINFNYSTERHWNNKSANYNELMDAVLAGYDEHKEVYAITYDQVAKYFLDSRGACDKISIFETKDLVYQYTSVWYYGAYVSFKTRENINKAISKLRKEGDIRKILERETVSELSFECGNVANERHVPYVFNICLYFITAPGLLFLVLNSLRACSERSMK